MYVLLCCAGHITGGVVSCLDFATINSYYNYSVVGWRNKTITDLTHSYSRTKHRSSQSQTGQSGAKDAEVRKLLHATTVLIAINSVPAVSN